MCNIVYTVCKESVYLYMRCIFTTMAKGSQSDSMSPAEIRRQIRDECREEAHKILDETAYNFQDSAFGKKFNM